MTLEERSNLVLAFAQVLFVNGQATESKPWLRPSNLAARSDCVPR